MHVALYFGSFNPFHLGHYAIAKTILDRTTCQALWYIVSPHNPLKDKKELLDASKRLALIQEVIMDDNQMIASDIEFNMPQPSYTYNTMLALSKAHPSHTFSIVMGGDSFAAITKWKNYKELLRNYDVIVYKREGALINQSLSSRLKVLDVPLINISATAIRQCIKQKKHYRHLVPDNIWIALQQTKYYH